MPTNNASSAHTKNRAAEAIPSHAAVTGKPRTSFHSFRHTYRDALREADISAERVKALGGWANTETQEDYGKGLKPATPLS
jgi:integrase